MSAPSASQTLAAWVIDLRYADIDAPTVAYAKELLLDHLGCAARGGTIDTADAVARMLGVDRRRRGHGRSPPSSRKAPLRPEWAVFANGVHAHSIELDDTHSASSLHPAVVTIPAALATAELQGSSGRGAAGRDRRGLRGRLQDRPRARSAAGLRQGLPSDPDRRAVRGRGGDGQAARALGRASWRTPSGSRPASRRGGSSSSRTAPGRSASTPAGRRTAATSRPVSRRRASRARRSPSRGATACCAATDPQIAPTCSRPASGRRSSWPRRASSPTPAAATTRGRSTSPSRSRASTTSAPPTSRACAWASSARPSRSWPSPWSASSLRPTTSTRSSRCRTRSGSASSLRKATLDEYAEPALSSPEVRAVASKVSAEARPDFDERFPARVAGRGRDQTVDGRTLRMQTDYPKGDPQNRLSYAEMRAKFRSLAGARAFRRRAGRRRARRGRPRGQRRRPADRIDRPPSACAERARAQARLVNASMPSGRRARAPAARRRRTWRRRRTGSTRSRPARGRRPPRARRSAGSPPRSRPRTSAARSRTSSRP